MNMIHEPMLIEHMLISQFEYALLMAILFSLFLIARLRLSLTFYAVVMDDNYACLQFVTNELVPLESASHERCRFGDADELGRGAMSALALCTFEHMDRLAGLHHLCKLGNGKETAWPWCGKGERCGRRSRERKSWREFVVWRRSARRTRRISESDRGCSDEFDRHSIVGGDPSDGGRRALDDGGEYSA
jgi:hypothetical protein